MVTYPGRKPRVSIHERIVTFFLKLSLPESVVQSKSQQGLRKQLT